MKNGLIDTLSSMNWNYGRGSLIPESVAVDPSGNGRLTVRCQYGTHNYRFTVEGDFVLFRGRRRKIRTSA